MQKKSKLYTNYMYVCIVCLFPIFYSNLETWAAQSWVSRIPEIADYRLSVIDHRSTRRWLKAVNAQRYKRRGSPFFTSLHFTSLHLIWIVSYHSEAHHKGVRSVGQRQEIQIDRHNYDDAGDDDY